MDALVVLIPLLPFCAALIIGLGSFSGLLDGEESESTTATIAVWSITLSSLQALLLLFGDLVGKNAGLFSISSWLSSGSLNIRINFISSGFYLYLAVIFSLLLALVSRFAINTCTENLAFTASFLS